MAKLTQSYAHGVSTTPLIGETIGVAFRPGGGTLEHRDALIVRQQNVRWTYGELKAKTDAFAAGLLALGLAPGDRIGIWSPNNSEWVITQFATAKAGLILVNINPAYRLSELEYALNKVGCKALITADSFKTSDYVGMLRELAPEIERAAPGRLRGEAAAGAGHAHPHRRAAKRRGFLRFDDVLGMGGDRHRDALAGPRRQAAVRRPDQHPVHQRHDRRAQGRDAHPPQHPQQRLLHRRGDAPHRPRPRLHSGAALSLLRHGARQPRLHHPRRGDGLSRGGVRPAGDARSRRGGALHRRSTACRPCSSPSSAIPSSRASISVRCAPASWPARRARSR